MRGIVSLRLFSAVFTLTVLTAMGCSFKKSKNKTPGTITVSPELMIMANEISVTASPQESLNDYKIKFSWSRESKLHLVFKDERTQATEDVRAQSLKFEKWECPAGQTARVSLNVYSEHGEHLPPGKVYTIDCPQDVEISQNTTSEAAFGSRQKWGRVRLSEDTYLYLEGKDLSLEVDDLQISKQAYIQTFKSMDPEEYPDISRPPSIELNVGKITTLAPVKSVLHVHLLSLNGKDGSAIPPETMQPAFLKKLEKNREGKNGEDISADTHCGIENNPSDQKYICNYDCLHNSANGKPGEDGESGVPGENGKTGMNTGPLKINLVSVSLNAILNVWANPGQGGKGGNGGNPIPPGPGGRPGLVKKCSLNIENLCLPACALDPKSGDPGKPGRVGPEGQKGDPGKVIYDLISLPNNIQHFINGKN